LKPPQSLLVLKGQKKSQTFPFKNLLPKKKALPPIRHVESLWTKAQLLFRRSPQPSTRVLRNWPADDLRHSSRPEQVTTEANLLFSNGPFFSPLATVCCLSLVVKTSLILMGIKNPCLEC